MKMKSKEGSGLIAISKMEKERKVEEGRTQ